MSPYFERIDTAKVYMPLLLKARDIIDECRDRGSSYWAISGFRSYEEQGKLYAQGRNGNPGPIVTQSRPGFSAHNFGVAIDFAKDAHVDRAGLQPDWSSASYNMLGEVAERHGLKWGGRFDIFDGGHVQWPSLEMEDLRFVYENAYGHGGLEAVWFHLDSLGEDR